MNWILYDTILVFFKTIVSVAVGSIGNNDTVCNAAAYIILIFGKKSGCSMNSVCGAATL